MLNSNNFCNLFNANAGSRILSIIASKDNYFLFWPFACDCASFTSFDYWCGYACYCYCYYYYYCCCCVSLLLWYTLSKNYSKKKQYSLTSVKQNVLINTAINSSLSICFLKMRTTSINSPWNHTALFFSSLSLNSFILAKWSKFNPSWSRTTPCLLL